MFSDTDGMPEMTKDEKVKSNIVSLLVRDPTV